jgi:hypothetical protein
MKNLTRDLNLFVVRNARNNNVRLVFFVISLGLFILSAGAPDATGGL